MRKDILTLLAGIEGLLAEILLELRHGKVPAAPETSEGERAADKWLQDGIDNILGFQAGGKRGKQA